MAGKAESFSFALIFNPISDFCLLCIVYILRFAEISGHTADMMDMAMASANRAVLGVNHALKVAGIAVVYSCGYIALFRVAVGKPWYTDSSCPSMSRAGIVRKGCDSLWAKAGRSLRNDEVIVYTENQATISYLVKIA